MISGIDLTEVVNYSLKGDTENPTIFKLGIIPSYLLAKVSSLSPGNEIDTAYKLLQLSIKGWENFNIPFETAKEKICDRDIDVVPIAVLERIPLNAITELSAKVMELNKLSAPERKN